ncbi:MAG TPA: winged helix DNA-binding domain-containing protein [Bacteroidales bacterium]|nr:winged helix DNA-binding domain-containing protein [Bacteroidales bacterium]
MNIKELASLRLANQQLASGNVTSPKDLAGWMGAIQAQDFRMARWAVGLRIPGSTIKEVDKAIDDGEIIRTHVLRPTWHFVAADDLMLMLDLSATKIMASLKYRQNFLRLTPGILSESNAIISEILKGKQLGREEIEKELNKGGVKTDNNSLSHILLWAELNGIICSGKITRDKQTYALISERVPSGRKPGKKEALGILAAKYFKSHGPATIKDFGWWSGLSVGDIRTSLEVAGDELGSTEIGSLKYWFRKGQQPAENMKQAWLIPAYDEIIISYNDRSAIMSSDHHSKAVSSNGIFRPVVIVENVVAGLWKSVKAKDRLVIEISPFLNLKKQDKTAISLAAESYGAFLDVKTDVKYT